VTGANLIALLLLLLLLLLPLLLLLLQALALADKTQSELRRSIAELTKKCDDLLRHKRFLANQAAESSAFSSAARRNSSRKSQQGADGDAEGHGAAAAGLGEVHSEEEEEDRGEDDLECAVCRSAMSEELQVRCCSVLPTSMASIKQLLLNSLVIALQSGWFVLQRPLFASAVVLPCCESELPA
jgi:ABC-type multidrug transport system fused ATPase/permease subunit